MTKRDGTINSKISYDDLKADLVKSVQINFEDDDQLQVSFKYSSNRLYALVAGQEVNLVQFEAIMQTALFDMTVYRFNRLSEEGMKNRSQDGESITWEEDPYKEYEEKIKKTIKSSYSGWKLEYSGSGTITNRNGAYEYVVPIYERMDWFYDVRTDRSNYDLQQSR